MDDETPVIGVLLKAHGAHVERRQVALCEAPNRNHKLANQIDHFLGHCVETCNAVPAILRTNGFPRGRTAQAGAAIRRVEALKGLKLDLTDTEWHNLQSARDFANLHSANPNFLMWRRERQWLIEWISPLLPLISLPIVMTFDDREQTVEHAGPEAPDVVHAETTIEINKPSGFPLPVLIGRTVEGHEITWDPNREAPAHLNNFGFLVTGDAGSGKTQTICVLIEAACKQGLSVCIFDFKADYCEPAFVEPLEIKVVDVRMNGLPFNPMQPPPGGPSGVQPAEHAYELAGILSRAFKLGPVQEGVLCDAITETYESNGIAPREWVDASTCNWPIFDQVLRRLQDEPRASTMLIKLAPLADLGLFPRTPLNSSFAEFIDEKVSLKLNDLPTDEIKTALAEIIIIQLHGHALRGDQPRRIRRMVVFDEAHRVSNSRRLESLAREGRAFGVGIVIGTQFPDDIPGTIAGNLATQLYLKNNQAKHRRFVVNQVFGTMSGSEPRKLLDNLSQLRPLEGLFTNPHHQSALLRVVPHYERRN